MSWLIVTPARNEADRLPALARSLAAQTLQVVGVWVVVDDGSADGTAQAVPDGLPFRVEVVRRDNAGGLLGGSEFGAFLEGVEVGLALLPGAARIMKLDADVVLDAGYFAALSPVAQGAGLVTGVIAQRGEPSRWGFTRGPLKCYSRAAIDTVRRIPAAVGWDVVDEVALRSLGYRVEVVPAARATVTRRTGTSEGAIRAFRRAGVVSRWTGYHPVYFALRVLTWMPRRPQVVGSLVMVHAWATAGRGPFSDMLRRAKRAEQVAAMRRALTRAGTRPAPSGRS